MHALTRRSALVPAAALTAIGIAGVAWAAAVRRERRYAAHLHRAAVETLLNALTAGDSYTARHSRRVADLAESLAAAHGMRGRELSKLRIAALLHDMGKIDDRFFHIVHSPAPLSESDRAKIKQHPHEGADILQPLDEIHPGLMRIVESHHECWDGGGYPRGLHDDGIPLAARVISIADVFDAITQPRSYREAVDVDEAIEIICREGGTKFDPNLLHTLGREDVLRRWREIADQGRTDERRETA